jgi:phospholipid/cholesterol/gamma-HCH transport system ATP-binding protein
MTGDAAAPGSADPVPLLVERLHVRFQHQQVLRDINLRIQRGQTVAILGESGCGKTVLLKTLVGLIRPTQGRVLFDGEDLASLSDRQLAAARSRYGFVFQQAALFDSFTIGQNIAFPLRQHRRLPADQVRDIVLRHLADVGLPAGVAAKRPAELSGGMRKRVGLARALVLSPELVLYDEPTTGLDPIMSDVINELMLRIRLRGDVTSVIVTHDMTTARKVSDRVVMLYPLARLPQDAPQVIFDGTPEELEQTSDHRVRQFVRGEAGDRVMEMSGGA